MASEWTRARFGLRADDFVFLFLFDFYSYAERKNPMGLVRAFRQALADQQDVVLFIKCSHPEFDRASFAALQAACRADNIKLYEGVVPREGVNFLMATADCYVSLHRSEGYGLTLAEAMSLGKPAIATAYSGNMDFMTPNNSYLVDYRIVEIEKDYGPYSKGFVWADPDLDHAAHLMRCAYEKRDQAAVIGQQAREDLYSNLHPRVVGRRIRERLSLINH